MQTDKMIRMANQIAAFFATQPRDGGPEAVAAHIQDFWTPDMRAELTAHVAAGGEGLHPLAREAAGLLRPAARA